MTSEVISWAPSVDALKLGLKEALFSHFLERCKRVPQTSGSSHSSVLNKETVDDRFDPSCRG